MYIAHIRPHCHTIMGHTQFFAHTGSIRIHSSPSLTHTHSWRGACFFVSGVFCSPAHSNRTHNSKHGALIHACTHRVCVCVGVWAQRVYLFCGNYGEIVCIHHLSLGNRTHPAQCTDKTNSKLEYFQFQTSWFLSLVCIAYHFLVFAVYNCPYSSFSNHTSSIEHFLVLIFWGDKQKFITQNHFDDKINENYKNTTTTKKKKKLINRGSSRSRANPTNHIEHSSSSSNNNNNIYSAGWFFLTNR